MRIHVLGLGPIGSLVAHHLRRTLPPQHTITLVHKNAIQAVRPVVQGNRISVEHKSLVTYSSGYRSEVFEGPSETPTVGMDPSQNEGSIPSSAEAERDPRAIESLFITAKAHHTLPAVTRLKPRLSTKSTIVLLQNGMGIYEELVDRLFQNPAQRPHFILASNSHGAFLSQGNVVHAGLGSLEFGIVPDFYGRNYEAGCHDLSIDRANRRLRLHDITTPGDPQYARYESLRSTVAALLLLEQLNVSWKPISSIQLAMRRKVVVNAVINPLTAIMGCRNGDIFKAPESHRIMSRVCGEAASVFAAQIESETTQWLDELSDQGVESSSVDPGRVPFSLTQSSLEKEVLRVAELTSGNKSSMLVDIERGRSTEIDYISGYLLRLGSAYRKPMITTATLRNLVKMRSVIPLDQM